MKTPFRSLSGIRSMAGYDSSFYCRLPQSCDVTLILFYLLFTKFIVFLKANSFLFNCDLQLSTSIFSNISELIVTLKTMKTYIMKKYILYSTLFILYSTLYVIFSVIHTHPFKSIPHPQFLGKATRTLGFDNSHNNITNHSMGLHIQRSSDYI